MSRSAFRNPLPSGMGRFKSQQTIEQIEELSCMQVNDKIWDFIGFQINKSIEEQIVFSFSFYIWSRFNSSGVSTGVRQ